MTDYSKDPFNALEAKTEAQKLAFSPITFPVSFSGVCIPPKRNRRQVAVGLTVGLDQALGPGYGRARRYGHNYVFHASMVNSAARPASDGKFNLPQ